MRICSLIPGATEVIAALDLADQLVGISHECDYPPSVRQVLVMIEPLLRNDSSQSIDIDRQVKELVASGERLYRLDEEAFCRASPELIVTQDLCHVCAVTPDQLTRAIRSLPHRPNVLALSPTTLDDVITDVERIADAAGVPANGKNLADGLRYRLHQVQARTRMTNVRPRVVCLEWLAPLYLAGHWVPEMIALAGGQDVLRSAHTPSRETTWQEVEAAQPDIILVMPCGYSIDRTLEELRQAGEFLIEWQRVCERYPQIYVVDAASYFSRPGPRLIDGVELLASILQPTPDHPIDPIKAVPLRISLASGITS